MNKELSFDPFAGGELLKVSPTTAPQKEILTAAKMSDEANTAFNEAIVLSIDGSLDVGLVEECFNILIERHDILRTTFSPTGDELCLQESINIEFAYEDLREYDDNRKQQIIQALLKNIAITPMNLEEGPLFLVWVKQLEDSRYELIIATHHLVCDGWSFGILLKELVKLYNNGGDSSILAQPPSFYDYAEQQSATSIKNIDSDFWLDSFEHLPPTLDLPLDRTRPATRSFSASRFDYSMERTIVGKLPKAASALKSSKVNYILAAYFALLYRLTGNEDIVVGLPLAGQAAFNQLDLFGHLVHLIPIRVQFSGTTTFAELVNLVKLEVIRATEHPNFTFGQLLEKFTVDRSRVPIISTIFNIDQPSPPVQLGTATAKVRSVPRAAECFEIFLNIVPATDELLIEATYAKALFSDGTMSAWLTALESILKNTIQDQNVILDDLQLANEPPAIVQALNQTSKDLLYSDVISAFAVQLEKNPAAVAVIFDNMPVTYGELDQSSSQLAQHLYNNGVREGSIVGICCQRSGHLLRSTLAILKLGAAYLPLDPDFPEDRLVYMIEDSQAVAVIEDNQAPAGVKNTQVFHLNLHSLDDLGSIAVDLPKLPRKDDRLAYTIYTSGSTGKPKGVNIPNSAMINFLESMAETPGFTATDRLLAVTTLSFDISVLELFLPLIVGGTTIIANSEDCKDGEKLAFLINQHKITVMQATPSTWRLLLASSWSKNTDNALPTLKSLCGGEPLPQSLVNELLPHVNELWNMYGPTETTVWSTCKRIDYADAFIAIGPPIANTQIYILDRNLNPLPLSVPGELCIGGDGVTLGYRNRPELNADRFVVHPDFGRIYRTGDVAQVHPNGEIQHLGRMDDQVKLRGYRIELGEIETALANCDGVKQAAVYLWNLGEEDIRIVACCESEDGSTFEATELRKQLRAVLPNYMVPQYLLNIDSLPLTPNGKIDRRALPHPAMNESPLLETGALYNVTEKLIAGIWADLLKIPNSIGREDNFFELGGHSLLAIQMLADIKKNFRSSITLREFFEQPTIHGIAALIDGENQTFPTKPYMSIEKSSGTEAVPLSLQQGRLWYLDKLNSESLAYNLPGCWRIRGPLDAALLEKCIKQIFHRHDILRICLRDMGSYAAQEVQTQFEFKLPITDLSTMPLAESEREFQAHLTHTVNQPLDLYTAPLIKLRLYKLAHNDYALFMMPHHIIWDGWSFDVFHNELNKLYTAALTNEPAQLPELPVQYRDYALWQAEWMQSGTIENQLAYWKTKLGDTLPILEVSTDYPRPAVLAYEKGSTLYFNLNQQLTNTLTMDAQKIGATLFMALLAAFKMLLHRFSGGQRDIIVGAPIAGRNFAEINNLIGFFVNTLVLRSTIDPDSDYRHYLDQLKETCLEAFDNQDTPFERIVEMLNPVRDLSRSPVFQALFSYQDIRNRESVFAGMPVEQINVDRPSAQTDIDLWVRLSNEGITGGIDYNPDLFKHESMARMIEYYKAILMRIAEKPDAKINELIQLPKDEYQLQVCTWNETEMDYPSNKCVHQLFEAQASKSGNKVAVVFDDKSITYAELDNRANHLARFLTQQGLQSGNLAGIYMDRSIDMVIALLGILKAGAGYVPLDPEYPTERIQYMVEDAGIRLLLTQSHLQHFFDSQEIQSIHLDTQWEEITRQQDDHNVDMQDSPNPENIAYVIYTSGSTGKPKGVEIPHRALVNFLTAMSQSPGISQEDILLAVTTLSFDIAGLEIFLPLVNGAKLILANRDTVMDPSALQTLLTAGEVTIMQATPSTWRMLLVAGWQGNRQLKALCGGEAFPKDLARSLVNKCKEVWNMYGPTETTIWSTCYRINDPEQPILVGRPIGNTQAFILDGNKQPLPIGVPGELYLGGEGVSLGYHNRADLTEKAFVRSPFAQLFKRPTIYKTGDLCRYRADGNIEYLHRIDTQVKVRGFRIELGEIESRLEAHEAVKQAVAIVKELAPGDARIAAYVVPHEHHEIIGTEMRKHLRKNLPDYMIPQYFFEEESLPLTPAGKIDRKLLGNRFQIGGIKEEQLIAPATDSEKYLASVWMKILKIENVSTHHNFFNIGGHSLLAMQVIARIAHDTGVKISPRDMLLNTLAQIAFQYSPGVKEQRAEIRTGGGILQSIKNSFKKFY